MKDKNKNRKSVFRGKPVVGARTPKEMSKMTKKEKVDTKEGTKTKKKKMSRIGVFRNKGPAKSLAKDLEKVGRDVKIRERKVRTRGGGPKIETSFSVYQGDKD